MPDAHTSQVRPWQKFAAISALLGACAALAMLLVSGYGYRWEWWPLGTAFNLLRGGAYLGIAVLLLGAVSAWLLFRQRALALTSVTLVALVLAAGATLVPYQWLQKARAVPPIHDITTDTLNPPDYVAIAPLRQAAPNPVSYDRQLNAQAQQQAYPDIQTLQLPAAPERIFSAALATVHKLGWELVAASAEEGRIEATDTSRWFGFQDDVVIRIRAAADQTLVDVRSKSRVGKSDVGANAKRIRLFRKHLLRNLE